MEGEEGFKAFGWLTEKSYGMKFSPCLSSVRPIQKAGAAGEKKGKVGKDAKEEFREKGKLTNTKVKGTQISTGTT